MKNKRIYLLLLLFSFTFLPIRQAMTVDTTQYWMKIHATDKFQRSLIADTGASIEIVRDDYVIAYGNLAEKNRVEELGLMDTSFAMTGALDFPSADAPYHNYAEVKDAMTQLVASSNGLAEMKSIGKTTEGRDMWLVRISGNLKNGKNLPAVFFMGGHHAREHLSVETPLKLAQFLVSEYQKGNARIQALLDNREIHILPAVNPDGLEYDIATGSYKYWRKNRRMNSDGTSGVDLNRNYGYGWGTGGSSKNPNSDTYMGPAPFSEPETQAIKKYIEENVNITVLLSFHTFSQLILYPWGGKYDAIADARDRGVFETMAKKMATWNGYTPEKSSDLYIASGDTTDWAYGEHKIFAFTFELDPANSGFGMGGFYPGAGVIDDVFKKNIEPCLYLIGLAENPYQVINQ